MTRFLIAATLAVTCLLSCELPNNRYTKHDPGLFYRVVVQGDGETVQHGGIVKLYMKQVYKDSVLYNNTDSVPFYQVQDSAMISPAAYTLFGKVRKGDSIIFKALTDSVFKDNFPPFAKQGEWLYTHVFIQDVLPVGYNYQEDMKNEMRIRKMPIPE